MMLTATEIKDKLDEVLRTYSPSFKTAFYWIFELKRCRTHSEDTHRSGRLDEVITEEMLDKYGILALESRGLSAYT